MSDLPPSPLRKFSTAWTVLSLLAQDKGNKKIAEKLKLSTTTIKGHLRALKERKFAEEDVRAIFGVASPVYESYMFIKTEGARLKGVLTL